MRDEEELRQELIRRLRARFPDVARDMTDSEVETWLQPTLIGQWIELSLEWEELIKVFSKVAIRPRLLRKALRLLGVKIAQKEEQLEQLW